VKFSRQRRLWPQGGQSDRERNSSKTNVEGRLIRRRQINLRSSFHAVSYEMLGVQGFMAEDNPER
jgi:hypothetical protein